MEAVDLVNRQNQALANATLERARTQIGVHEATGHNDGASVEMYQHFVSPTFHHVMWCACFVFWCLYLSARKLGIRPTLLKTGSSANIWAQARAHGLVLKHPVPGCIGLVRGGPHGHEHTFLVESVSGGVVHSIDGNWSNSVRRATHPISGCDFVAVA